LRMAAGERGRWGAAALRFTRIVLAGEVPVMTGPQDPAAAGRDRLRAGHADREQAIETLKAAFVQGRLTREELAARAGQAFAARTYADLAALTADIPPAPLEPAAPTRPAGPARPPAPARRRPLGRAAAQSGICLIIAAAAVWVGALFDADGPGPNPYHSWGKPFFFVAVFAVLAALGFLGNGVVALAEQRRPRGQLPPGSGHGGHALEGLVLPKGLGRANIAHRQARQPREIHMALRSTSRDTSASPDLVRVVVDEVTWFMSEHKISRADLAQSMGVSPGRVSQILSGDENLTLRTLSSVVTALGAEFEVNLHAVDGQAD
jgi:antitoxin component HigA of HigAB toxin-antitoxin module